MWHVAQIPGSGRHYTIARGLVFTLTAGRLFLGDDTSVDGDRFDDVTKVAGVVNYGF